jgi:hypothetical protein
MTVVAERQIGSYVFRGMEGDLATYDEVFSSGNYLADRPPPAVNSRAAKLARGKAWLAECRRQHPDRQMFLCPRCLCPCDVAERHDVFRKTCYSCGVNRIERLFASVVERWGANGAVLKLKALAKVD